MPDGGEAIAAEYFHTRQEGAFKPLPLGDDGTGWLAQHRHELDAPPLEVTRNGLVVVSDPSPSSNPDHHPRSGVGVEHVLSEYTLRAAGIYRPEVEYPTLSADDAAQLSTKNQTKLDRTKERNRAPRGRSRIVRDGNAPQVDPSRFEPEQRWAADAVNLITRARYSAPTGHVTSWLTEFEPDQRATAAWIFRHVSRGGGGSGLKKKFKPSTIFQALATSIFPTNMQIDGDVPTPYIEWVVLPRLAKGTRVALASRITTRWSERAALPQAVGHTPGRATTRTQDPWVSGYWECLPDPSRHRALLAANLRAELHAHLQG